MPTTRPADQIPAEQRCPCGSGDTFGACCGPIIRGQRKAATAEALMRSRYTAFSIRDLDHVERSWHPDTRPRRNDLGAMLADGTRWLRLEIRGTERGGPFDADGVVTFRAYCRTENGRRVLKEISRFVREDGAWLYVEGTPDTAA